MHRPAARRAFVTVIGVLASLLVVSPVGADHLRCGQVVTIDTTLHADLGPCPDHGPRAAGVTP